MNPTPQPRSNETTERIGRMTRAMRAALPAGETVLRVGLMQDGRIMEERRLRHGQSLSIGSSEKCDFTIASQDAPRFLQIFSWTGKTARLHLTEQVSGRLLLESGACDLTGLRRTVELARGTRGKIVIGGAALLFQLVVEPPRPARPQLPLSLKSRPLEVDWLTTIVGALSFLLHFGVVGTLYSDWADSVLDEGLVISGLVDAVALPPPPMVEQAESSETPTATTATAAPKPQRAPVARDSGQRTANRNPADAAQAGLSHELQTMAFETIGSLNTEATATSDVLRDGELPTGPLDAAARDARGISGSPELALRTGGPLRPGREHGSLVDLGNTRRAVGTDTGHLERPRGPTGNVTVPPPTKTGIAPNAERVIYGLRAAFRQCYQRGLDQYPDAEGAVRLTFAIGPNGEPANVGAAPSGNLPPMIVSCIQTRARSAQFEPPEGGSAVVVAPVILKKQ
jgi:hypothetical protein